MRSTTNQPSRLGLALICDEPRRRPRLSRAAARSSCRCGSHGGQGASVRPTPISASSVSEARRSSRAIASCRRRSKGSRSASACASSATAPGALLPASISPPTRSPLSLDAPSRSPSLWRRSTPSRSRLPTSRPTPTPTCRATRSIRSPSPKTRRLIFCSRSTIGRSRRS